MTTKNRRLRCNICKNIYKNPLNVLAHSARDAKINISAETTSDFEFPAFSARPNQPPFGPFGPKWAGLRRSPSIQFSNPIYRKQYKLTYLINSHVKNKSFQLNSTKPCPHSRQVSGVLPQKVHRTVSKIMYFFYLITCIWVSG